jgi:hypothetical protein
MCPRLCSRLVLSIFPEGHTSTAGKWWSLITPPDLNGPNPRVLRGGSWNNNPQNLRAANRNRNAPANRNNNAGFRLSRTLSLVVPSDSPCGEPAGRRAPSDWFLFVPSDTPSGRWPEGTTTAARRGTLRQSRHGHGDAGRADSLLALSDTRSGSRPESADLTRAFRLPFREPAGKRRSYSRLPAGSATAESEGASKERAFRAVHDDKGASRGSCHTGAGPGSIAADRAPVG